MAPIETTNQATTDRLSKPASAVSVKSVLLAVDFPATSAAALPYATAICHRFGSTLHLVHVLSDTGLLLMTGGVDYVSIGTILEDAQNEAMEKLEQICGYFGTIPHRNYVKHGQVWKNLALIIEANEVDLIVVGTHGRTGLGKLLLGSVAEDILRHARCPVLTVGPKVSGRAKLPGFGNQGGDLARVELDLRQIVFATNFAESAPRLAQEAVSLADEFHARLTVMHVMEDYTRLGSKPEPIAEALRQLKELVPANAELQYIPEILLDFGHAPERILKAAQEREADMIVLGARGSHDVGSTHLPWSVAPHVIAQAHCPVLTVRE
jgi:nucleotide-binding universal stress UspA family protein